MPLQAYDIQVDQACDWSNSFIFATPDPSGQGVVANAVYYNLTGTAFELQVRDTDSASSAILITLTIGSGLALITGTLPGGLPAAPAFPNGVSATLTNAQTVAMPVGVWAYDLIQTAGAVKTCFMKGSFTVRSTVSR